MKPEERFEIEQLIEESRARVRNAINDNDLIELADAVDCLAGAIERMVKEFDKNE